MRILIDGYNLLFQSTLVGRSRRDGWLQQARMRLIGWLADRLDESTRKQTKVVFDAHRFRRFKQEAEAEQLEALGLGIRVTFANDHDEADDLLEQLIRQHSHPKGLLVVSSDHRIQKRALARKCKHQDSEVFWDEWESKPAGNFASVEKESTPTDRAFQVDESLDSMSRGPINQGTIGEGNAQLMDESEVEFWLRAFGSESGDEDSEGTDAR